MGSHSRTIGCRHEGREGGAHRCGTPLRGATRARPPRADRAAQPSGGRGLLPDGGGGSVRAEALDVGGRMPAPLPPYGGCKRGHLGAPSSRRVERAFASVVYEAASQTGVTSPYAVQRKKEWESAKVSNFATTTTCSDVLRACAAVPRYQMVPMRPQCVAWRPPCSATTQCWNVCAAAPLRHLIGAAKDCNALLVTALSAGGQIVCD